MKIMFYIHSFVIGGAERVVSLYSRKLTERGVDVVVVVNEYTNSFLEKELFNTGVKIVSLYKNCKDDLCGRILRHLRRFCNIKKSWEKLIIEEKPDLIHVHTAMDKFFSGNYDPRRIIYTFHSEVNRSLEMNSKKNYDDIMEYANRGMHFIALTESACDKIREKIDTSKVYVVPNGIEVNKIKNEYMDKTSFLNSLNISEEAFIVGHVGRFNPVKNHERVIAIFLEIKSIKKDAHLLLIGGDEYERVRIIKDLSKKYGINGCVHFLGLRQDSAIISSLFDVCLMPSFSEAFPLSLIEAQAHGVRCVGADTIPKDVICNNNCFLLSLDESNLYWAEIATGKSVHPQEMCKDISYFDIDNIISRVIRNYENILASNC